MTKVMLIGAGSTQFGADIALAEKSHPLRNLLVGLSSPKRLAVLGDGSSNGSALSTSTGGCLALLDPSKASFNA